MKPTELGTVAIILLTLVSTLLVVPHSKGIEGLVDPCDTHGDCISSSLNYVRSSPDRTFYSGDSFSVELYATSGSDTTGYSVSFVFDQSVFERSEDIFTVIENVSGTFEVTESITFVGFTRVGNETQSFSSTLTAAQSITVVPLIINLKTWLVNVTGPPGPGLRNPDGSFYRNDSLCDSWNATFGFARERQDIKINLTSVTPSSLRILSYSADPLGRTGRFCYTVETNSGYRPYRVVLEARALNWQGVSLGLKQSSQPFAVVQYNPKFTTYAYMLYGNSTAPSSLQRPWVLFVRYDGNPPGYSYAGDSNTRPFNGNSTLAERAYFDDFRLSTMSYKPSTSISGGLEFRSLNSTGSFEFNWLDARNSAPLYYGNRIEKYVFNASASSLSPLLSQGFIYQNVTMVGCWQHEKVCDLRQNYWLVPFLWSGRINILSTGPYGNIAPDTPIMLKVASPSPLDSWLIRGFQKVFGNDAGALRSFEADLYPTNATKSFSGHGRLSLWFNQTGLAPPLVTITVGNASLTGDFTFVPVPLNSSAIYSSGGFGGETPVNSSIPLWAYNMAEGNLAYIPFTSSLRSPSSFIELTALGSGTWLAGGATDPQTPQAFAAQGYGFWPMAQNLTIYANLWGGGVELLGTQRLSSSDYQATFLVQPWSGGVTSVKLAGGNAKFSPALQLTASPYPYPSPVPASVAGIYSVTYPASGADTTLTFTNMWGASTMIDLGIPKPPPSLQTLVPTTTLMAFGTAALVWFFLSALLVTRQRRGHHP